jgi:hypothetical protein
MNKNKNMKSSKKEEESVNVRRVRQVNETNETNTNKKNKKEKPSVVSRSVRMREMSYTELFYKSLYTNMMNFYKQVKPLLPTLGGKFNEIINLDLLSYPDNFEVNPYYDYMYGIKIIKDFEYTREIELSYKEIFAFTSRSDSEDETGFTKRYDLFNRSREKLYRDIENKAQWSAWDKDIEGHTFEWNDITWADFFYGERYTTGNNSLFTWKGKIVVTIDTKWNISISFKTEDGWLPNNKQWIYGNIHIFRNELQRYDKYLRRITYYEPPSKLDSETVYDDPYVDNKPNVSDWEKYRVIREKPTCGFNSQGVADAVVKQFVAKGVPYYYGPYYNCDHGTIINYKCLQGFGRYIYVRVDNKYDIGDGRIFVSKKEANSKFIASCNAHIVGYYDGKYRNDQDIKVKINFMCAPPETNIDPLLFPCLPLTNIDNRLEQIIGDEYKVIVRPKLKKNQTWTASSSVIGDFYNMSFTSNLNNLIVNSDYFVDSNAFMAIFSNSNGAINFRLGTADDGFFDDGDNPRIYFERKNDKSDYTYYVSINCEANRLSIETRGNYMGYIPEEKEAASGTFTLFVTQDEVKVNNIVKYRGSVIKIALRWSISFTKEYYWGNKIKKISFTCLRVIDESNKPLN